LAGGGLSGASFASGWLAAVATERRPEGARRQRAAPRAANQAAGGPQGETGPSGVSPGAEGRAYRPVESIAVGPEPHDWQPSHRQRKQAPPKQQQQTPPKQQESAPESSFGAGFSSIFKIFASPPGEQRQQQEQEAPEQVGEQQSGAARRPPPPPPPPSERLANGGPRRAAVGEARAQQQQRQLSGAWGQNVFNIRLEPMVEFLSEPHSALEADEKVCQLIGSGVRALMGPREGASIQHVQSICDNLEIPYFELRTFLGGSLAGPLVVSHSGAPTLNGHQLGPRSLARQAEQEGEPVASDEGQLAAGDNPRRPQTLSGPTRSDSGQWEHDNDDGNTTYQRSQADGALPNTGPGASGLSGIGPTFGASLATLSVAGEPVGSEKGQWQANGDKLASLPKQEPKQDNGNASNAAGLTAKHASGRRAQSQVHSTKGPHGTQSVGVKKRFAPIAPQALGAGQSGSNSEPNGGQDVPDNGAHFDAEKHNNNNNKLAPEPEQQEEEGPREQLNGQPESATDDALDYEGRQGVEQLDTFPMTRAPPVPQPAAGSASPIDLGDKSPSVEPEQSGSLGGGPATPNRSTTNNMAPSGRHADSLEPKFNRNSNQQQMPQSQMPQSQMPPPLPQAQLAHAYPRQGPPVVAQTTLANKLDDITLNLYPPSHLLNSAYMDLIHALNWTSFTVVYEETSSMIKLQDLFRESSGNLWTNKWRIRLLRVLDNEHSQFDSHAKPSGRSVNSNNKPFQMDTTFASSGAASSLEPLTDSKRPNAKQAHSDAHSTYYHATPDTTHSLSSVHQHNATSAPTTHTSSSQAANPFEPFNGRQRLTDGGSERALDSTIDRPILLNDSPSHSQVEQKRKAKQGAFRDVFWRVKMSGERNVLLDVKTENLYEALKQAQQVGCMTEDYSYIITSLDLHMIDLEDFKYSRTKITGFSLVQVAKGQQSRLRMAKTVHDSSIFEGPFFDEKYLENLGVYTPGGQEPLQDANGAAWGQTQSSASSAANHQRAHHQSGKYARSGKSGRVGPPSGGGITKVDNERYYNFNENSLEQHFSTLAGPKMSTGNNETSSYAPLDNHFYLNYLVEAEHNDQSRRELLQSSPASLSLLPTIDRNNEQRLFDFFVEQQERNISRAKLSTSSAILHDSLMLYALALNELDPNGSVIFNGETSIQCSLASQPWPHGSSLVNYMRQMSFNGLSGTVSFDQRGLRSDFKLDVLGMAPNIHLIKVGEWHSKGALEGKENNKFPNLFDNNPTGDDQSSAAGSPSEHAASQPGHLAADQQQGARLRSSTIRTSHRPQESKSSGGEDARYYEELSHRYENELKRYVRILAEGDQVEVPYTRSVSPNGALLVNDIIFERLYSEQTDKVDTLVVTAKLSQPYFMLKETPNKLDGNDQYEGYAVDLIHELSKLVNFKYKWREVADKKYGSKEVLPNGTVVWNGMIGEIVRGQADLAIVDLTITTQRQEAVDFTLPFMNTGISILFKKPTTKVTTLFSFLSPFSSDVWAYVLAAYCGISAILFLVGHLSPYEWADPHPCGHLNNDDDLAFLKNQFSLLNSFWFTIGSLMQQGSDLTPRSMSTRTIAGIWYFFTLIMISSYTANLAAFLTVEKVVYPIENVRDLSNQQEIKYGCVESGSTCLFFHDSQIDTYRKIDETMSKYKTYVRSNDEGQKRVGEGKFAFFMESTTIEYIIERNCNLTQIGGLIDSKGYGLATSKKARHKRPYRTLLNEGILHLQETGMLHVLKNRWWKERRGGGTCTDDGKGGGVTELSLANVGGVFVVLLGGLGISFLVAIAEFMWAAKMRGSTRDRMCEEMMNDLKFALACKSSTKPTNKKRNSCTTARATDADAAAESKPSASGRSLALRRRLQRQEESILSQYSLNGYDLMDQQMILNAARNGQPEEAMNEPASSDKQCDPVLSHALLTMLMQQQQQQQKLQQQPPFNIAQAQASSLLLPRPFAASLDEQTLGGSANNEGNPMVQNGPISQQHRRQPMLYHQYQARVPNLVDFSNRNQRWNRMQHSATVDENLSTVFQSIDDTFIE